MSEGGAPLLQMEGIRKTFVGVEVLHGIDLELHEGEGLIVVGRNGAGKSTLVRVLAGLHPARSGSVRLGDIDVTGRDAVDRVGQGMTAVLGGDAVFGSLTVEENLRAFGHLVGKKDATARTRTIFEALPVLAERRHQLAATLSGGQQQQLGLAKALLLRPRVLLIDEPTLGLAPVVAADVLRLLTELRAEGTALLISDESLGCVDVVDRALLLRRGEVVGAHPAGDLRTRPEVLTIAFELVLDQTTVGR